MIEILAQHIIGSVLLLLGCLFGVSGFKMWDEHEDFLTISSFFLSGLCVFFSLVFFEVITIVV